MYCEKRWSVAVKLHPKRGYVMKKGLLGHVLNLGVSLVLGLVIVHLLGENARWKRTAQHTVDSLWRASGSNKHSRPKTVTSPESFEYEIVLVRADVQSLFSEVEKLLRENEGYRMAIFDVALITHTPGVNHPEEFFPYGPTQLKMLFRDRFGVKFQKGD
jgi:hypothetical protein